LDARVQPGFHAYNVTHDAPPLLTQREFLGAFGEALGVRMLFLPVPVGIAQIGVTVWSVMLRALQPRRYSGLAGAAVWFVVGDNPYTSARIQRELSWKPPFDARTAIARSVSRETESPGGARA
jgi:hypothetical protein